MFRPLGDRIVIERISSEEVTKGGIFIPETTQDKPLTGKIVTLGTGDIKDDGSRTTFDVQVGDIVYYSKYAGMEIDTGKEVLFLIVENDILGIVTED